MDPLKYYGFDNIAQNKATLECNNTGYAYDCVGEVKYGLIKCYFFVAAILKSNMAAEKNEFCSIGLQRSMIEIYFSRLHLYLLGRGNR